MANRRVVDRDEFERTVFDTEVVDAATAQAVARLTHYLERRVGVAAADVAADLEAVTPQTATVAGTAGRGYRRSVIGVAVLAAAVLFAWNVGPLVLAAGAVAGFAVPRLRNWLGKRAATKYEEELSRARGAALQSGHRHVRRHSRRHGRLVRHHGPAGGGRAAGRRDRPGAAAAARRRGDRGRQPVHLAVRGRPPAGESSHRRRQRTAALLHDAVRSCKTDLPAERGSAGAIWLGETWCDDPTGLVEQSRSRPSTGQRAPVVECSATRWANRLRWVLGHAVAGRRAGRRGGLAGPS